MSEAAEGEPPSGFFSRLLGLYFTPGETMRAIARRPTFWAPLLAFMAVGAAFNGIWLRAVDPAEFARVQIEDSPVADRLSPQDRAQGAARQARLLPYMSWLVPLVFSPLSLVLMAAFYLFVFRFLYGGEVTFYQSLAIVTWTSLAVALVDLPLSVLVLYLKDDWNVDPHTALQANASLLLDRAAVPRAVYALAQDLDLFAAWTLILLSLGYAAATPTSARRAAIGIVVPWVVFILGRAALAAYF